MADRYFDSTLTPEQEAAFNQWLMEESRLRKRDVSADLGDYDLRGHWLKTKGKHASGGHMTDEFKKPNHPTFSEESKYTGANGVPGGHWDERSKTFTPSPQMITQTHPLADMNGYFQEAEPDYKVRLPPMDLTRGVPDFDRPRTPQSARPPVFDIAKLLGVIGRGP